MTFGSTGFECRVLTVAVDCCSTPAYDYAPNLDKQWILQVTPQMAPIHRQFTDLLMTKRLQTLQSVDDAVDKVHENKVQGAESELGCVTV
jgi:hypothetical protein